jgi:hypothetical protein
MADKKPEPRPVFAVTERDDKSFWTRVGAAFPNKDGSVNIFLDALPVSGKLQIRDDDDQNGNGDERRGDRSDRRGRRG